jgi:hypothetical protein
MKEIITEGWIIAYKGNHAKMKIVFPNYVNTVEETIREMWKEKNKSEESLKEIRRLTVILIKEVKDFEKTEIVLFTTIPRKDKFIQFLEEKRYYDHTITSIGFKTFEERKNEDKDIDEIMAWNLKHNKNRVDSKNI